MVTPGQWRSTFEILWVHPSRYMSLCVRLLCMPTLQLFSLVFSWPAEPGSTNMLLRDPGHRKIECDAPSACDSLQARIACTSQLSHIYDTHTWR